jgi:CheY-like chemotaxis protein
MRPVDEIQDPAKLLDFAKSKRLLQFSSHESLGEITALLYKVVVLADKNMPIKAYLDVIREMQATSRQVEVLGGLSRIEAAVTASAEISDKKRLLEVIEEARRVMSDVRKTLQEKITVLQDAFSPYGEVMPALQKIVAGLRPLAFEDEFMLAVAFLDLEVSKLGAITYLKGESPDYKETKRNRSLLDTRDESVLKNISAGLARPNDERGSVEKGMIASAHKRLAKLIDLHAAMPEVVRRLNEGATKLDVLRDVKVGFFKEKLTHTDYDIIIRMARREKLIAFRNRQKGPANNYELRSDNHQRVKAIADKLGITPRRALNKILDDFFALTAKQAQFGMGKASKPGKE